MRVLLPLALLFSILFSVILSEERCVRCNECKTLVNALLDKKKKGLMEGPGGTFCPSNAGNTLCGKELCKVVEMMSDEEIGEIKTPMSVDAKEFCEKLSFCEQ